MERPCHSMSSRVLPMMVTRDGSRTAHSPARNRAAPTPPARATISPLILAFILSWIVASESRRPVILVALGAALWGTDSVLRQPLTHALPSSAIVLYEHLILSVIAVPTLIAARAELRAWRMRHWLALVGIAWGGSALATVLFTEAIGRGNPDTAILLQKAQPLFTFLLAGPPRGRPL